MDGLIRWPNEEGPALIGFIVRDGDTVETLYGPTMSEIEKLCKEYDLDVGPIKDQMSRYPGAHTFFVDVALYRGANTKE